MRAWLLLLASCATSHAPTDASPDAAGCEPQVGVYEISFTLIDGNCSPLGPIVIDLDRETHADGCVASPATEGCSTRLDVVCAHGSLTWSLRGTIGADATGEFTYEASGVVGACSASYIATAAPTGR